MISREWDIYSFITFICIGIIISQLFKIALKCNKKKYSNLIYFIIFLIMTFFASFRLVYNDVGGVDADHYIDYLLYGDKVAFSFNKIIYFNGYEYFFYNLLFIIGKVTTNYHTLFIIIYSLISYSYIKLVKDSKVEYKSYIILTLILLPYLKSFNLIRNAFAIALLILAIENLKEKKNIKFFIFSILAILSHYMSAFILVFYIANIFFNSKFYNNKILICRKNTIIFTISVSILILIFYNLIYNFFSQSGFSGYIDLEISLLGYMPYIFVYILMIIFQKDLVDTLKNKNTIIYFNLITFFIVTFPLILKIGAASRMVYYFEHYFIIMLAYIYEVLLKKIKIKDKPLINFIVAIFVFAWITFIIYKIHYSYGLMPYIFTFKY